MKLGTFLQDGERRLFMQLGDMALDLRAVEDRPEFRDIIAFIAAGDVAINAAMVASGRSAKTMLRPMADLNLAAPILPTTVLCSGSNYRSHNEEKAASPLSGREPEFFLKSSDCVVGPGGGIVYDPDMSQKLDCETELAIVIGRPGRHIPKERALDHVFGYTIANDVTARDRQVRKTAEGVVFYELGRGKAFDSSLPLGPVIVTSHDIPDPQDLTIKMTINGDLRQCASTSEMIWTCADLIHFFSTNFTLRPGMMILTGTPAGTAWSVDKELGGIGIRIQDWSRQTVTAFPAIQSSMRSMASANWSIQL